MTRLIAALLFLLLPSSALAEDQRPGDTPVSVERLNALAQQHCPWQPDPIPPLNLLMDENFEWVSRYYGRNGKERAFVVFAPPYSIYMRESIGNARSLCHEWRHIVDEDHWRDHGD